MFQLPPAIRSRAILMARKAIGKPFKVRDSKRTNVYYTGTIAAAEPCGWRGQTVLWAIQLDSGTGIVRDFRVKRLPQ